MEDSPLIILLHTHLCFTLENTHMPTLHNLLFFQYRHDRQILHLHSYYLFENQQIHLLRTLFY